VENTKIRVAYSCAGEGFGHAARLVALAPLLEERYEMYYFVPEGLKRFITGKLPRFTSYPLPHFSFVKKEDRVQWFATFLKTIPQLIHFGKEVETLEIMLQKLGIQAVLSDYDPYLAWAGKRAGIPVLQINHPGIISRTFPLNPFLWIPALVSIFLEGPWTERIHVSFFHGDVGPLFRPSLFKHSLRDEGYILVNLKPAYREPVLRVLRGMKGIQYRVFPSKDGNFEEALAGCTAVLSSAGHQIISEALHLGKPILVIPQKGQYEQQLNARMLRKTNKGTFTTLSRLKKDLPAFLSRLDVHRNVSTLPKGFTLEDGTGDLLRRIDSFLRKHAFLSAYSSLRFIPQRIKRSKGTKWVPLFQPRSQL